VSGARILKIDACVLEIQFLRTKQAQLEYPTSLKKSQQSLAKEVAEVRVGVICH
jgi:hypothetical protein